MKALYTVQFDPQDHKDHHIRQGLGRSYSSMINLLQRLLTEEEKFKFDKLWNRVVTSNEPFYISDAADLLQWIATFTYRVKAEYRESDLADSPWRDSIEAQIDMMDTSAAFLRVRIEELVKEYPYNNLTLERI